MTSKVIILKGLPGAGKSTWAKAYCKKNPNFIRVNKDDLRAMFSVPYSDHSEPFVLAIRNEIIKKALKRGDSVVVDDTNLDLKHDTKIREIAFGHSVEVKWFDVPLSICLRRNARRDEPVPEEVIRGMAERYNVGKENPDFKAEPSDMAFDRVEQNVNLPQSIIVDIDGTIADKGDRHPFHWDKVSGDIPHTDIIALVHMFYLNGYTILFVSGRNAICRADTEAWLQKYCPFTSMKLYMRQEGDTHRKDTIVKYEILQEIIKEYYVELTIDDRNSVCKMWREAGIRCLQVANGNF